MRPASVIGALVTLALLWYMLNAVQLTPLDLISSIPGQAIENLAPPANAVGYEANYIWYNRILDTIFQALVLLTALISVMVLFRRGGSHG